MEKPDKTNPKNGSFLESANHAILGLIASFRSERNLRIHFLTAILVLLLGLRLGISRLDLVLLILAITFIFMAEMVNTAVEILTNAFVDSQHPSAKLAKDVAAGGVLVTVVGAIAVGYLVFYEPIRKLTPQIFERIKGVPPHVTVVALLLVMILTIVLKTFSSHGTPLRGGMPSGHAALAFATATVILWFAKDLLVISAAFLLAVMVAQSRVEARVHGWWEVVSGAMLGLLFTLTLFQAFLKLR